MIQWIAIAKVIQPQSKGTLQPQQYPGKSGILPE
jgi:hypothetical protein